MNDFSISMALVDYIPVVCFAIGAVILLHDLYSKMGRAAFSLLSAGVIDVICAGGLKATWKLLYAAGVCDFSPLNAMFFPVQSIGFMLAGIGMILMLTQKGTSTRRCVITAPVLAAVLASAAPAEYRGTFIFVGLMVAGLGCLDTVLAILAKRLGKPVIIAVFVVSFICSLGMGYLSSKEFDKAIMNWIAEGVNVAGQGTFLLGAYLLHKNGLSELTLDA